MLALPRRTAWRVQKKTDYLKYVVLLAIFMHTSYNKFGFSVSVLWLKVDASRGQNDPRKQRKAL
ncbi:MAG: hypothetical protein FWG37_05155 [Clostridia bacterium]|nr:hypothetical protein [Clostridia bacterium]